jgi:hypothetical protein
LPRGAWGLSEDAGECQHHLVERTLRPRQRPPPGTARVLASRPIAAL